ncbi:MAG: MFS transporter [Pseudomonadota bacterium]
MTQKTPYSFKTLGLYCLPAIPLASTTTPLLNLMPAFYAQEVGIPLATIGIILLSMRALDVITDTLIGTLSDRTALPGWRRKIWMAAGAPVFACGIYFLFTPPDGAGPLYLTTLTIMTYLGWTMLQIPYQAWGAELSGDYNERSRIAGYREIATVIGILLALSIPFITSFFGHGIDRTTMTWVGILIAVLIFPSVAIAVATVPEPVVVKRQERLTLKQSMTLLVQNKPFRFFFVFAVIIFTGNAFLSSSFVLYVTHYIGSPTIIGPVYLLYYGLILAAIHPMVLISRRFGKHRTTAAATLLWCLFFFCIALLPPGSVTGFVTLMLVSALPASAGLTLPVAILADVIDYDTLRSGQNRTGLYFAIWSMIQKGSAALGIGVALPLLAALGFSATGENDTQGLNAIRFVGFGLSIIPYIAGSVLLWFFPLDARRQDIIARRLARRASK